MKKIFKKPTKDDLKRLIITSVSLALFLGTIIFLIIYFWPSLKALFMAEGEEREILVNKLRSYGSWAWIIIVLLLALQIIIAILPNGPFSIIAGMMYGPFVGVILSLIGIALGSFIVVLLIKAFGKGFASIFVNYEEKEKQFKNIDNKRRTLIIMFGYALMPGLPDDFLVFLVPFLKIKFSHFIITNLIARTPSIIVTVLLGNSFITGDYTLTIVLMAITVLIGLLCIIFNKQITKLIDKIFNKEESLENKE